MSSFEQGLKTGSDVLTWLLNITGGVVGFLLPFIAVGGILIVLAALFAVAAALGTIDTK